MAVKGKLVELLWEYDQMRMMRMSIEECVDRLVPKGVTVSEGAKLYWKPVKPGEWNLTCSACDSHLGCREDANFCPECGAKFVYPKAVAPQPPKGE